MTFNPVVKQIEYNKHPKPLPKLPQKKENNVGGRTVKIATNEEKTEIINQITDYFQACSKINEINQKMIECENKFVREFMTSALNTTNETLCYFANDKLKLIRADLQKNFLITSEEGMKEVIIPFVKKYSIKKVDLSIFKDQLKGKSLELLLKALPETNIKELSISAAKIAILTNEEKNLFIKLKKQGIDFYSID